MGWNDAQNAIKNGCHHAFDDATHWYALKKKNDSRVGKHTFGSFRDAKKNGEFEEYDIM